MFSTVLRYLWPGLLIFAVALPATAQDRFTVALHMIEDRKAVFATVESIREAEARTRIVGTVRRIGIREGDAVEAGQVVAEVEDPKFALQLAALDARLSALAAQRRQAGQDFERTRTLRSTGVATQARLDEAQMNVDVFTAQIAAAEAERAVLEEQRREGAVLAPQAGRVLRVRGVAGGVVTPGETIATIATDRYVLRLRLPERHARFLRLGDTIEVGARGLPDRPDAVLGLGRISLVYPQLLDGQVVADAQVEGLGDFFVGERVRVTIAAARREVLLVPATFVLRRPGVDLLRLAMGAEIPVRLGDARTLNGVQTVEVLSGLRLGDVLLRP